MNFSLDHSLAILRRTPATLDALLRDLPDDWTQPNEGPDTCESLRPLRDVRGAHRAVHASDSETVQGSGPWREYLPVLDR